MRYDEMFFFFQLIHLYSHLILRGNIYLRIGISVIYLKCIILVEAGRTQHQYLLYTLSKNILDISPNSFVSEHRRRWFFFSILTKFHISKWFNMKIILSFLLSVGFFCGFISTQNNVNKNIPAKISSYYLPVIDCLLERQPCLPLSDFLASKL